MKSLFKSSCLMACMLTLFAVPAFADPQPAAKFAAMVKGPMIIPATANSFDWKPVLSTTIKVPSQKDLLIGVSFETGLYTNTQVSGKNGATVSSTASADLQVKVLLNNQELAFPKSVTFDRRLQTLSATLGGVIQSCTVPLSGVITIGSDCIVTDEMVGLVLDTLSAHHFNFVAPNLASGTYNLQVLVKGTAYQSGMLAPNDPPTITVGNGALTVEQVRGTNLPDGIVISTTAP
jgi:hypothetical protein